MRPKVERGRARATECFNSTLTPNFPNSDRWLRAPRRSLLVLAGEACPLVGSRREDRSTLAAHLRGVRRAGRARRRADVRPGRARRPTARMAGNLLAGERVAHPRRTHTARLLPRAPLPAPPAARRPASARARRW